MANLKYPIADTTARRQETQNHTTTNDGKDKTTSTAAQSKPRKDTLYILRKDSLEQQIPTQDSLTQDSLEQKILGGDSLSVWAAHTDSLSTPLEAPLPYRDTTIEAVMGQSSTLFEGRNIHPQPKENMIDSSFFQVFVLIMAALYAMLLHYNMADIRALFERVARDSSNRKGIFEEYHGSGFMRFLNTTGAIGLLFMGILAVKYSQQLMPNLSEALLPSSAALPFSLIVTAICTVIFVTQWLILVAAGALTRSLHFVRQLHQLRQLYFTLAVIIIAPTLLLYALTPNDEGEMWFFLIIIELAVTLVLYLKETLNLFISKKISILHWILYLCTVEVFPISLLVLIAIRLLPNFDPII